VNGSKQRTYKSGKRLQPCLTDLVRLKEIDMQWLTIIEDETSLYKTDKIITKTKRLSRIKHILPRHPVKSFLLVEFNKTSTDIFLIDAVNNVS